MSEEAKEKGYVLGIAANTLIAIDGQKGTDVAVVAKFPHDGSWATASAFDAKRRHYWVNFVDMSEGLRISTCVANVDNGFVKCWNQTDTENRIVGMAFDTQRDQPIALEYAAQTDSYSIQLIDPSNGFSRYLNDVPMPEYFVWNRQSTFDVNSRLLHMTITSTIDPHLYFASMHIDTFTFIIRNFTVAENGNDERFTSSVQGLMPDASGGLLFTSLDAKPNSTFCRVTQSGYYAGAVVTLAPFQGFSYTSQATDLNTNRYMFLHDFTAGTATMSTYSATTGRRTQHFVVSNIPSGRTGSTIFALQFTKVL
jgi:hypothetical protein